MPTFTDTLKSVGEGLLDNDIMTTTPTKMRIGSVVEAWVILDNIAKVIGDRKKVLRLHLLGRAEKFGRPTERGGQMVKVDTSKVLREKRISKTLKADDVRELLETRNIPFDDGFSKVTTVVVDPSKLETLVNLGKLPQAEVEALHQVTWALRVKAGPDLEEVLDETFGCDEVELKSSRPKKRASHGSRKV